MTSISPSTVLYHQTLEHPSSASACAYGSFSAPGAHEVVVARTAGLSLLRLDNEEGTLSAVCEHPAFGVVRCVRAFRLQGEERDSLAVGSDSGRLTVLRFDARSASFEAVHSSAYGRTGCRRLVPGQMMAVDPAGRALMVAAVEKQKLVYVLNREPDSERLAVSSPLEAHKARALVLDCAALDVGFENPLFACLEVDYGEAEEAGDAAAATKRLTLYELDLGLNHVTRKRSDPVDAAASGLLALPGGERGPGGLLLLCDGFVVHHDGAGAEGARAALPRRFGSSGPSLVTAAAAHVQKSLFFALLQAEEGDLFKVQFDEGGAFSVSYFDSVPACAAMCVLRPGFLFGASEFADHYLMQITGLDGVAAATSRSGDAAPVFFLPRAPANLLPVDQLASAAPVTDALVADLGREGTPQAYALCGRGHRSSLRVLRHGLGVAELAVTELPGTPSAVWALPGGVAADAPHRYLVVSFANDTVVLEVGDEGVSEVRDSGLLAGVPTLHASTLADGSLLQAHARGLQVVRPGGAVVQWSAPALRDVAHADCNGRQVVVALKGGEVRCFQLAAQGGAGGAPAALHEVRRKTMGRDVVSVALEPVPPGRGLALRLAVATYDNIVRLLSLDPADPLRQLSMQGVNAAPSSVLLSRLPGAGLLLHVGLANGVLMRLSVDDATGSLSDARKKFLGSREVRLAAVAAGGAEAVLAVSARSWLVHPHAGRLRMSPLSYHPLLGAARFRSPHCPEGLVAVGAVAGGEQSVLRVVQLERLGETFNQTVYPLDYTPRRVAAHPVTGHLVLVESDNCSVTREERKQRRADMRRAAEQAGLGPEAAAGQQAGAADADGMDEALAEQFVGPPRAEPGTWAGVLRVLDPRTGESVCVVDLPPGEAAFSLAVLEFASRKDEVFCAVGTVKDLVPAPRSFASCSIRLYKFAGHNTVLELVHATPVDEPCLALRPFAGALLAGVGDRVRLLECGASRLLLKAECGPFAAPVRTLHPAPGGGGRRVFVGDMCEGFSAVRYTAADRRLEVFAEGDAPRHLTAACVLDRDTVAGADKFGTVFLSRVPEGADEPSAAGGVATMSDAACFFVGDVVTSLHKVTLVRGGAEVLMYTTLSGGVGMLQPFATREDVDFCTLLQMHMRQEAPPLLGRDHLAYRSYYFPVKGVVDGDLCARYASLSADRQRSVAEELGVQPSQILKKLEELWNRVL